MERYENAVWQNGTVITAASLNRIEENLRDVIGCVIDMGSNLTTTNKIKAGKLQVGVPETETEIGNGDALITGNVIINGTPGNNNHAVTKGYVDGKEINALEGITATGTLGGNGGITIGLSAATTNTLGGIKVGSNLSYNNNVLDLPIASASAIGGIKVGSNLTINGEGVLSATDTTYSVASASANGLMSSAHFSKLNGLSIKTANTSAVEPANNGLITLNNVVDGINVYGVAQSFSSGIVNIKKVVTGIKINENTIEPSSTAENGIVDISSYVLTSHQDISSKANTNNPNFTGTATFDQISIANNTITIGNTDITEASINNLYNLQPSSELTAGTYILQMTKGNNGEITYAWVSTTGGEEP